MGERKPPSEDESVVRDRVEGTPGAQLIVGDPEARAINFVSADQSSGIARPRYTGVRDWLRCCESSSVAELVTVLRAMTLEAWPTYPHRMSPPCFLKNKELLLVICDAIEERFGG